jgi:hypothetical protein
MKKIATFILFLLTFSISFAQQPVEDVVYLKNGGVIRGTITELVMDEYVKIITFGDNIMVFQAEEVEKISKEPVARANKPVYQTSRRGYIGISLGASFPQGNFADPSGGAALNGVWLNLVNFGYVFNESIGISANWYGGAYPLYYSGYDPWSVGGMMGGLLVPFQLSEIFLIDLRPMIGYAVVAIPDAGMGYEDAISLSYNLGLSLRGNVSNKFALLLMGDYFYTQADFSQYQFKQKISTISVSLSAAYRLK